MRVCVLTTSYPRWPGDAAGNFVASLVEHLVAEQDIEHTVLAPAYVGVPRHEQFDRLEIRRLAYFWPSRLQRLAYRDGIPINLKYGVLARINVPSFLATFAWALCVHARRADIIHAHWGVLGALAVATQRIHRKPVIVTVRGSDLSEKTGLIHRVTAWGIRHADVVTMNCSSFYEICCSLRRSNRDCYYINNGVDLPSERELAELRRIHKARDGAVNIITVGRLIAVRRHELLVRVFSRIRRRHPLATLTIVGDGPRRNAIQLLVERLGLTECVRLVGEVPSQDVSKYLAAADLYVSATIRETFGNAVAESAAHALPVITTRVGFPATLVKNGETGYVVESDKEDALVESMLKMLAEPCELRTAGQAMRKRIEELGLTWSQSASRFADVYRGILQVWQNRERGPARYR